MGKWRAGKVATSTSKSFLPQGICSLPSRFLVSAIRWRFVPNEMTFLVAAYRSELKSRAGLQTCIALKCQTTPFMDMDMDEAYPAAPDVTAVVETSTLAIENGLERVVDIPSAMGGNNVKIE
eukprot:1846257-Rhodomonas_salina.1